MTIRHFFCCFLFLLLAAQGFCQTFDPFEGKAPDYHARLSLFFPDRAAELRSRDRVLDSVQQFEQSSVWNAGNLKKRLDIYQQLQRGLQRHYQYFRVISEQNRKDTVAKTLREAMARQLDGLVAKTDSLLQNPMFAKVAPKPYAYLMQQEHEEARHRLTPAAARSKAASEQEIDALTSRYDDLIDTIKPGKDRAATLHNYAAHGEAFAAILISITRFKQAQALSQSYRNAPEQFYSRRLQLPEDSVKAVFKQVAASAKFLQAYRQLPAGSPLRWQALRFTEVRRLVNEALSPLGADYQARFARLLDPANGLLDIAPGADRAGGGNSFGTAGTPVGLYMKGFDGGLGNLSTLIHEGGHAVHRQLMSENGVMPSYASGPNFLSEAVAMLNEFFLLDELKREAKTDPAKSAFSRLFADKLAREIFTSAEEGSFEQALYDGIANGTITTYGDINALYTGIMRTYDPVFDQSTERQNEWIAKRLVFEDPLYNANYLFAILVTCKLYTLHRQDPQQFAAHYHELLSRGVDAPAVELLQRNFNIQLNYSALLKGALSLLQAKTAEVSR